MTASPLPRFLALPKALGGYDLANQADLGFAFDYNGTGGLNNITLYRPAHGNVAIYQGKRGD